MLLLLPPVPTVVGQLTATNGTTLESDPTVGSEYQYSYFSSYYSVATVVEAIFLKRVGNCANVMARSFVRLLSWCNGPLRKVDDGTLS